MNRLRLCAASALFLALGACAVAPAPTSSATERANLQAEHQRLLPLQGVQNARDIGGYRTTDGRMVKWDVLYRTGELSHLTDADRAALRERGVRTIHDLRTVEERSSHPTAWNGPDAPVIEATDYTMEMSGFAALFQAGVPSAAKAREVFAASYPEMLKMQRPQHRALFADLLKGDEGAILYHCTAGKDRTGMATALILSALGVPRDTIIADYELSNRYYSGEASAGGAEADPRMAVFLQLPADVRAVFMGVDAAYLQAMFDMIDREYGSIEQYLAEEIGVSEVDIARLRALYTE